MHPLEAYILEKWSNKFDHFSLTVGLSGGVDSMVLLNILNNLKDQLNIKHIEALHINHGISKNAHNWESLCIRTCDNLKIKLNTVRYSINKNGGESLENNARIIRYNEFAKQNTDMIALAHHKLDQVETTLSQIMRGSDLHNIAGMLPVSTKNNKKYWRPLLEVDKNIIIDYARHNNISYIEDESNQDITYLRNFIRLKLYPLMHEYDEHIANKIINLSKQIQAITLQLDEITQDDFKLVMQENYLNFKLLSNLSINRQFNILIIFLKQRSLPIPSNAKLREFIRQINTCTIDKKPSLAINNTYRLIKDKDRLYIINLDN